jgi:hypothetical protein
MPRFAKKTDKSQADIVRELRQCQIQVIVTNMGNDFPDLLVCSSLAPEWVLLEVKEENGKCSRGQLQFIADAKGYVAMTTTFKRALEIAVVPNVFCFKQEEKDLIAVWLEKNPNVKQIAVRKFFRTILSKEFY